MDGVKLGMGVGVGVGVVFMPMESAQGRMEGRMRDKYHGQYYYFKSRKITLNMPILK